MACARTLFSYSTLFWLETKTAHVKKRPLLRLTNQTSPIRMDVKMVPQGNIYVVHACMRVCVCLTSIWYKPLPGPGPEYWAHLKAPGFPKESAEQQKHNSPKISTD